LEARTSLHKPSVDQAMIQGSLPSRRATIAHAIHMADLGTRAPRYHGGSSRQADQVAGDQRGDGLQ